MTKLILAAFATSALIATANAGPLGVKVGWGCHTCEFKNGTQLTGLALGSASVSGVILPSGEAVDLR